jgi:hypothetical protein
VFGVDEVTRSRVLKLLRMGSSAFPGEAGVALQKADKIVREKFEQGWEAVIGDGTASSSELAALRLENLRLKAELAVAQVHRHTYPTRRHRGLLSAADRQKIAAAAGHPECLSAWEINFLNDVRARGAALTIRQRAVLDRISLRTGRR